MSKYCLLLCFFLFYFSKFTLSQQPVKGKIQTPSTIKNQNLQLSSYNYHAIVIAVQNYRDKKINSLRYPATDADSLISILETDYCFRKENVIFLKDPTRKEIFDAFEKLITTISENDHLLIFYAGHGYYEEKFKRGYWLPSDASKNDISSWVSNSDVRDFIYAIHSQHTLLLTDACFGGTILDESRAFHPDFAITKVLNKKVRMAMTSGSKEAVPDKSVFVEYLIKGLKYNSKSFVTASDLFINNIKGPVLENTENTPIFLPIKNTGDEGGGDFIFLKSNFKKADPSKEMQNSKTKIPMESSNGTLDAFKDKSNQPNIKIDTHYLKKILPPMVLVKGGTFNMGEYSWSKNTTKAVEVTVNNYSISKYEITLGDFRKFISATGYLTSAEVDGFSYVHTGATWDKKTGITWEYDFRGRKRNDENFPVTFISWYDADAYCKWLSKISGKTFRLPTEAEWEYAAKGGNLSHGYTYSGSNIFSEVGWREDQFDSLADVHKVGTKKPNELGIYDMSGNASEWCQDWYGNYPSGSVTNPTGESMGEYRVYRGGHWNIAEFFCTNTERAYNKPGNSYDFTGFRVVSDFGGNSIAK